MNEKENGLESLVVYIVTGWTYLSRVTHSHHFVPSQLFEPLFGIYFGKT